jgi:t-SNARE complex subunit (syntaxin)
MQIQLNDQYSSSEIDNAHDQIVQLQENLNKIEELYQQFYSTLDHQQNHIEQIGNSINQTEINLEKGQLDLHEILQIQRTKDKRQCLIIIFIFTTACFFLLIVISVLINVIQTFGFKRGTKSTNDR